MSNWKGNVTLLWDGESGGEVNVGDHPSLRLDTPVEYGGKGRYPCPDELFLAAIGGCLLTTFLYFKRKLSLNIVDLKISVDGNVSSVGPEGFRIDDVNAVLHIITSKIEKSKAKKCTELTRKFCHITRTLEKVVPIKIIVKITPM
jgi:putative redox protein